MTSDVPTPIPDAWEKPGEPASRKEHERRGDRGPSRATIGALAGIFAAALTAGALIGFGNASGGSMRLFAAIGRLVLGAPVVRGGAEAALVASVGLLVHVAQVTALGALLGLVAARARGMRLAALALMAAILAAAVHLALAPAMLRLGNAATVFPLQRGQLVALYLLLATGLGCGMRVALLCLRLDERSS